MTRYCIRSGNLFAVEDDRPAVRLEFLKLSPLGNRKRVFASDGRMELETNIEMTGQGTSLRNRRYTMTDPQGGVLAVGSPEYEESDDPDTVGWSIYRVPCVDHVLIKGPNSDFSLRMLNSQNYRLLDAKGRIVFELIHHGLCGGWNIEAEDCFEPKMLLGFFIFCRYLEQENEFVTV